MLTKKGKITIDKLLKLVLKHATYREGDVHPDSVFKDVRRHGNLESLKGDDGRSIRDGYDKSIKIGRFNLQNGDDVNDGFSNFSSCSGIFSVNHVLKGGMPEKFADLFTSHLHQGIYLSIHSFFVALTCNLDSESAKPFLNLLEPNANQYNCKTSDDAVNILELIDGSPRHSITCNFTKIQYEKTDLCRKEMSNKPLKIFFNFKDNLQKGEALKTVNIEQWPSFIDDADQKKFGDPDLEIDYEIARRIAAQVCYPEALIDQSWKKKVCLNPYIYPKNGFNKLVAELDLIIQGKIPECEPIVVKFPEGAELFLKIDDLVGHDKDKLKIALMKDDEGKIIGLLEKDNFYSEATPESILKTLKALETESKCCNYFCNAFHLYFIEFLKKPKSQIVNAVAKKFFLNRAFVDRAFMPHCMDKAHEIIMLRKDFSREFKFISLLLFAKDEKSLKKGYKRIADDSAVGKLRNGSLLSKSSLFRNGNGFKKKLSLSKSFLGENALFNNGKSLKTKLLKDFFNAVYKDVRWLDIIGVNKHAVARIKKAIEANLEIFKKFLKNGAGDNQEKIRFAGVPSMDFLGKLLEYEFIDAEDFLSILDGKPDLFYSLNSKPIDLLNASIKFVDCVTTNDLHLYSGYDEDGFSLKVIQQFFSALVNAIMKIFGGTSVDKEAVKMAKSFYDSDNFIDCLRKLFPQEMAENKITAMRKAHEERFFNNDENSNTKIPYYEEYMKHLTDSQCGK